MASLFPGRILHMPSAAKSFPWYQHLALSTRHKPSCFPPCRQTSPIFIVAPRPCPLTPLLLQIHSVLHKQISAHIDMVQDYCIPRNADQFQSRRSRPSFSSALLEAISRSSHTNTLEMRSESHPCLQHQFFSQSPLLSSSSEAQTGRPLRRSADDFRLLMKQEPPLPLPQKQMKMKPMSPGSKLASFFNSFFTSSSSKRKSQHPKDEKAGSLSHSASTRSRFASTPSSNRVSDVYKRYDSSVEASPKPFSLHNRPSAVKRNNDGKTQSHRSVTFCPTDVMLDEKYKRVEKDEPCSLSEQHSFHTNRVLYEEEEEDDVASDSSSDLFELENLNVFSTDLPVFGTTHLERNTTFAKGLL